MKISYNKAAENPLAPFKMAGNWEVLSKALKDKFSKLTDADLNLEPGKEEDLFKRVESRLHINRDEVINIIRKEQPGVL